MYDWKQLHAGDMGGLPTVEFPAAGEAVGQLPDAASAAWRIDVDGFQVEETWPEAFARFSGTVELERVEALVAGNWAVWSHPAGAKSAQVVDALVGARDRLPALRHLFVGDIESEECEISWIEQSDMSPLLEAFPRLESLCVRGGTYLEFKPLRHENLRFLKVESGGLDAATVRTAASCDFPALVELDLWLGESNYGGTSGIADLAPILDGTRLPALRSLALRNSEIQDEIAAACAGAPVVARLKRLDLFMGVLTDEGVTALLDGQPLSHLEMLDLHHHFLTEPVRSWIEETLSAAGVAFDLDDDDAPEDDQYEDGDEVWRSVAVGE